MAIIIWDENKHTVQIFSIWFFQLTLQNSTFKRSTHRTDDKSKKMANTCWAHTTTEVACAEADSRRSQKSWSHESVCVWAYRGTYESWQRETLRAAKTKTGDKHSQVRHILVPHSQKWWQSDCQKSGWTWNKPWTERLSARVTQIYCLCSEKLRILPPSSPLLSLTPTL